MKMVICKIIFLIVILNNCLSYRYQHKLKHKKNQLRNHRYLDAPTAPAEKAANETDPDAPILLDDEMLEKNIFEVTVCNQVVTATGMYINDLYNTSDRGPMTLVMNVYTLSIFTKETPDSLLNSVDMAFISDIKNIEGAPECLVINSKIENKELIPCFETLDNKEGFIKSYEIYKKCSAGQSIVPEMTDCEREAAAKAKREGGGDDSTAEKKPDDNTVPPKL